MNTPIRSDDQALRATDANVDVNNTVAGYIDVDNCYVERLEIQGELQQLLEDMKPRWVTSRRFEDYRYRPNTMPPAQLKAIRDTVLPLLESLIAHEGGHVIHLDHWKINIEPVCNYFMRVVSR